MTTNLLSDSLLGSAERRVAALAVAVALAAGSIGFYSWLEARDDRMKLSATIASQNSVIAAAEKREQDRAQQLADTLKQIDDLKRSVQTPQQVVREMPQFLPPLPQPLQTIAPPNALGSTGVSPAPGPSSSGAPAPGSSQGQPPTKPGEVVAPDVRVPSADLKPLFDFVQDCRACQAKLSAALQDAQDQRAKNDALARERDAAVKAARGGGVWTRTLRVARWVAVGFAAGYLAHAAVR